MEARRSDGSLGIAHRLTGGGRNGKCAPYNAHPVTSRPPVCVKHFSTRAAFISHHLFMPVSNRFPIDKNWGVDEPYHRYFRSSALLGGAANFYTRIRRMRLSHTLHESRFSTRWDYT
jgi:hypothetical protein